MILNIKERLMLLGLLPQEGTLSEMVDIYDLARELKISDDEKKDVSFIEGDNYIRWDYDKDPNKDILINASQMKIIKNTISKYDNEGKIKLEMVPLIDKLNG